MLKDIETALSVIRTYETDDSAYQIANRLRRLTKPAYTTDLWTIATGSKQTFLRGDLDGTILLAGEPTDFGHFIAALSDQINQPGLRNSDLTQWTADHTSWSGDLGSAIVTYYRSPEKFTDLTEVLRRFASESDQSANIAAFLIGRTLNTTGGSISGAISTYHSQNFAQHVQAFCQLRFGPGDLATELRRPIASYLKLASDSGLSGWVKNALKGRLFPKKTYTEADIDLARDYFLNYLNRRSAG
ncbi:MAG: hypothetical protein HC860_17650 [Alkalinema sp. RU_4_3]|nr:hypothetical protein [Alkalinema sp. RU_4_3]